MGVFRDPISAIRPIETRYGGRRYRSRLEARWAVYFDALSIDFEYERQGYTNGDACFLPDFWLPHVGLRGFNNGVYVEVKPSVYTDEDERQFRICPEPLIVVVGQPPGYSERQTNEAAYQFSSDGGDNYMRLLRCATCSHYTWAYGCEPQDCRCGGLYVAVDYHCDAVHAALSARFERGR